MRTYMTEKMSNTTHSTADELALLIKLNVKTPNTAKNYASAIRRFIAAGGEVDNVESIKSYLNTMLPTRHETFLYAIIKVARLQGNLGIIPELLSLSRKAKGLNKLARLNKLAQPPEVSTPPITINMIRSKAKAYPNGNKTYKFIAEFYANEVPLRPDTLAHVTTDKKKSGMNIFLPRRQQILLQHFKTVGTHGVKSLDLSPKVTKLLKAQFKATGSQWLLPSPSDNTQPMSANALAKAVKGIFGVGAVQLRHAAISEGKRSLSDEDFYALCSRMNTSVECGVLTYDDRHPDL
jgi:hypothetical protein